MGPTISFFHLFPGETFSLNLSCNMSQTTCPRLLMCLALSAVSSFKSPTSVPPTHPDVPSRVCDRPSRSLDPSWSSFERLPRQPLSAASAAWSSGGSGHGACARSHSSGPASLRRHVRSGVCVQSSRAGYPYAEQTFRLFSVSGHKPSGRELGAAEQQEGRLELGPAQRPSPSAGNHGPLYL